MSGILEAVSRLSKKTGKKSSPVDEFHSTEYLRHNQRRQEHLASLNLNLAGRSVLEVGAGIGDHTSFFLDRNCSVCVTEARAENVGILRRRFPKLPIEQVDVQSPPPQFTGQWEIVYAYGLLYHLRDPDAGITFMSKHCTDLLLLETCVSESPVQAVNRVRENAKSPSQAVDGEGSRPTRTWVFDALQRHFPFVYVPSTQPWHEQFPIDWEAPADAALTRAVFIASRSPMTNPLLLDHLPSRQERH